MIAQNDTTLRAPFPWFGGKSRAAHIVWPRFGDTVNYVEPFAGSLAVLLQRPFPVRTETVNDADCYLANFWRALAHDPDGTADYADWPVNEADLHARHRWLINQTEFREQMMSDPEFYDVKIAGWWVWGISAWIGSGWCSVDDTAALQIPHLADGGRGERRARIQTKNGTCRPNLRPAQGVQRLSRKIPHLWGNRVASGQGINAKYARTNLHGYMRALQDRLRRTRVVCGDWTRIVGKSVTWKIGTTAVFLDPPYNESANRADVYAVENRQVSTFVREWAIANGDNHKLRIALCGYEAEHGPYMPDEWDCVAWDAGKGYAGQRKDGDNHNGKQERIWFSPHCLQPRFMGGIVDKNDYSCLFAGAVP